MSAFSAATPQAYVVRWGLRGRVRQSLFLAAIAAFVAFIIATTFESLWVTLGEYGVLALILWTLSRTALPALSRSIVVGVDASGITVGGAGPSARGQVLVPWAEVLRIRLYRYSWVNTSEVNAIIHDYEVVHVDRREGTMVRVVDEDLGVDNQRLIAAIAAFAPYVPVTDEGDLGQDPTKAGKGMPDAVAPLRGAADRLRALRGQSRRRRP